MLCNFPGIRTSVASTTSTASTTLVASLTLSASIHQKKITEINVSIKPGTKMFYSGILIWLGLSKIHYSEVPNKQACSLSFFEFFFHHTRLLIYLVNKQAGRQIFPPYSFILVCLSIRELSRNKLSRMFMELKRCFKSIPKVLRYSGHAMWFGLVLGQHL